MDLMTFFLTDWLGKPAWMWLAFMGVVLALLVLDLGDARLSLLPEDAHDGELQGGELVAGLVHACRGLLSTTKVGAMLLPR